MRWLIVSCATMLLCSGARSAEWPQWLGPNRNGTTSEIVKPWKSDPKVVWRTEVDEGHSSPIVQHGAVFLHDKVPGKDAERLRVWDAASGRLKGQVEHTRDPFSSAFGGGPRATPVCRGRGIYTFGVTGRLTASPVWLMDTETLSPPAFSKETLTEFKAANLTFGVSASPLLEGDLVVVMVGGKGAGVVAFELTGKVAWKALDDEASYASPIAVGEGKSRQIIVLTKQGLASLGPKDGSVFWRYPFRDLLSESSTTPLKVGDLLIASSVTLGSVALKLSEQNGKPAVNQVWRRPELNCYFSTPVPVGKDYLYMINGVLGLKPSITLRCVETATGKILWQKSNIGKYHAALLRTGDDKLLMLDDGGHLTLIQPDPKEYRELARSKVCGETWALPALANGRLYLRDNKEMLCLQLGE